MNKFDHLEAESTKPRKRATWLGVVGGIVVQAGIATVLTYLLFWASDLCGALNGNASVWTDHVNEPQSIGWLVIQGIYFISAMFAGFVASWLVPRRTWGAPASLIFISLLTSFFAQLPATKSSALLAVWALSAPIGICIGVAICWRSE